MDCEMEVQLFGEKREFNFSSIDYLKMKTFEAVEKVAVSLQFTKSEDSELFKEFFS